MKDINSETGISLARANARGLFACAMFFSVFTNLLMLTGPLFMLQIYDRVLGSRSEETLVALTVLVAGLYFFLWVLEFARGRLVARVGMRFQAAMNDRVFSAVLERAALRRGKHAAGRLQDLETIRGFFGSPTILALFDAPWTPAFLAAIFIFHPLLGWLAVMGGGVLIAATALNQLLTLNRNAQANEQALKAAVFAQQAEADADMVWAQGMTASMTDRWRTSHTAAMDQAAKASDVTGTFASFTRAFRLFLQSAMLAMGAWLVLQGDLTAGAMIAASILLGRALAPVETAMSQWPAVQRARAAWKDLRILLSDIPNRKPPAALPRPVARLDVSTVSFQRSRGDTPVLHKVGFELRPGEALGVIGRSGSGKSTLARVLVGIISPTAGEVRIGGASLDQYGPERLGDYIGYLSQNVQLFEGTVAENIAQMACEPDQKRVIAAAQMASVHDVILRLPQGYNTMLGGSETHLSGGQKQRVGLARALYNDPVLLVLDEPNSALDAEGSAALNTAVETLKANDRAVVIMTHRPTAISACNKLLVLEAGKPAAYGPSGEIIREMMKNAGDVQRVVQRVNQ
ncbi:MAG: type I secretion system permease/ATPase [Boseongicola sp.]|nr:type I secretion system permease/ATPase [Boseongicola sp.]NNJ68702.1 type I secretion system permease/ATPase [Boseongicola sp.]